jgi:hypothetical protein
MSLLAQVNQPNDNGYYFQLDKGPADPIVRAPGFVAEGDISSNGFFTAYATDTTGAGSDVFTIASQAVLPKTQWSIGVSGVPAGANSGNNLAVFAYDDNGVFLNAPLQISRATGNIIMSEDVNIAGQTTVDDLVVTGSTSMTEGPLVVGNNTTVGGGVVQVNGPSGVSRVYDPIYNPVPAPGPGAEVQLSTFDNAGNTIALVPYTPAKSGIYSLTMEVRVDTAGGWTWSNGTNVMVGYLGTVAPPFAPLTDSLLACDSLANPVNLFIPAGYPPGVYLKDQVALVNLNAGTAYQPSLSVNPPGINLGTTGGVKFFIQPVVVA